MEYIDLHSYDTFRQPALHSRTINSSGSLGRSRNCGCVEPETERAARLGPSRHLVPETCIGRCRSRSFSPSLLYAGRGAPRCTISGDLKEGVLCALDYCEPNYSTRTSHREAGCNHHAASKHNGAARDRRRRHLPAPRGSPAVTLLHPRGDSGSFSIDFQR